MRVGIIQSSYIPWRGYFDFIKSVDLFLLFADIQYPRGRSWRNRNRIRTSAGLKWLTVPIPGGSYHRAIDQLEMSGLDRPWRDDHSRALKLAFSGAPFASDAIALWDEAVAAGDTKLSELNARLTRAVCAYLGIRTEIAFSRAYAASGGATDRLISLVKAAGATTYVSGPSAKAYLREDAFRTNRLRLEYKTYDYPQYSQLCGPFVGEVTVLDLIANCGPGARDLVDSRSPNEIAVAV